MSKKREQLILEGSVRETSGTREMGRLRRSGWIPGIIYGEGEKSVPVQVSGRTLGRLLHQHSGESLLVTLRLEKGGKAGKDTPVLLREIQHDPVTHDVIHVDFHHISLTKRVVVTVPLEVKGEAVGVKQEGGMLEHIRWELEVECLPTEIPEGIVLHVEGLKLNQSLHAREVPLPEGVTLKTDPEQVVVACVPPKAEEASTPEEAAAAETAEPEVLKQKSKEELAVEDAAKKEKKEADQRAKEDKKEKKE